MPANNNSITKSIYLIIFLFLITACSSQTGPYYKLCDIYAEIIDQPVSLTIKEGRIAEAVQKEFPDFFEQNFIYIMQVDKKERYTALKSSIEQSTKKSWDCEIIQLYYETN
ncbi:MAG: hypothetical protein PVG75_15045 [Thioalkalispiraceae bacterium]|jgi:hypothetical protein